MAGGESDSERIWIVSSAGGPVTCLLKNKETAERIAGIVARDAKQNKHHIQAERPVTILDETLPLFGE